MRCRSCLLALSLLLLSCASSAPEEARPNPQAENVRRLAAILDYVAADYGGAVADGKVKDEGEFEEQRSFMQDAAAFATKIGDSSVAASVRAISAAVDGKAPPQQVADQAREV